MPVFNVLMPKMGESVQEATITKIFVSLNDSIEEDQSLFEIATDKVDSEIPSPVDGVIKNIIYNEGDVVSVGEIIMEVDLLHEVENDQRKDFESAEKQSLSIDYDQTASKDAFLSPLVRSIIKKEKIAAEEVDSIKGSGFNGRIQKGDILDYLNQKSKVEKESKKVEDEIIENPVNNKEIEIVPMSRIRKVIAKHMVESVKISPHVSTVVEADVTHIVQWREKNKIRFLNKYDSKLTYMHLFVQFVGKALGRFPYINAIIQGENILLKKQINIGVAVSTEDENLVVPVVKAVNEKSLFGIVKNLNQLIEKARKNKLELHQIQDGTFTITNFGSIGALFGTPIINQPQLAILATGSIEKKPCVIETDLGDTIALRYKMYLSLSYDHRIIDGMMAGKFLNDLKNQMESFDLTTEI